MAEIYKSTRQGDEPANTKALLQEFQKHHKWEWYQHEDAHHFMYKLKISMDKYRQRLLDKCFKQCLRSLQNMDLGHDLELTTEHERRRSAKRRFSRLLGSLSKYQMVYNGKSGFDGSRWRDTAFRGINTRKYVCQICDNQTEKKESYEEWCISMSGDLNVEQVPMDELKPVILTDANCYVCCAVGQIEATLTIEKLPNILCVIIKKGATNTPK